MAYTGTSIVDYLGSVGQDSSYNNRAKLAQANGISNYTGTADQNTKLLSILNKPASTPAPTQSSSNTLNMSNGVPQGLTSMGVQAQQPQPAQQSYSLPQSQVANSTSATTQPIVSSLINSNNNSNNILTAPDGKQYYANTSGTGSAYGAPVQNSAPATTKADTSKMIKIPSNFGDAGGLFLSSDGAIYNTDGTQRSTANPSWANTFNQNQNSWEKGTGQTALQQFVQSTIPSNILPNTANSTAQQQVPANTPPQAVQNSILLGNQPGANSNPAVINNQVANVPSVPSNYNSSNTLNMGGGNLNGLGQPVGTTPALQNLLNTLTSFTNTASGTVQNTGNTNTGNTNTGNTNTGMTNTGVTNPTSTFNVSNPMPTINFQTASNTNTQNQQQMQNNGQNGTNSPIPQQQAPESDYAKYIKQLVAQSQMTPQELALMQQQADLKNQLAQQTGLEQRNPIPLEFQTGRIAALQNMANAQQQNLAEQVQTYEKQREVAGNILDKAVQATKPITLSPSDTLFNLQNGQAVNPNESQYSRLTNYAIAQNNITQGSKYAQDAGNVSNGLQLIKNLTPRVLSFMQQAGINSFDIPTANEGLLKYLQESGNPANVASYNAMIGEIRSSAGQLLLSSGLNPTDVSDTLNSFDFGNLSAKQLATFLQNLEVMGNSRLSALQNASQSAYGSNNSAGNNYAGEPLSNIGNFGSAPNANSNFNVTNNPNQQAVIGTGINALGGVGNIIQSLIGGSAGSAIVGGAKALFK